MQINLWDENFSFTGEKLGYITASDTRPTSNITWILKKMDWDITVFTDLYLNHPIVDEVRSKIKIAWLVEPKCIFPFTYNQITSVEDKFDIIITHDKELLKRPKYKLHNFGGTKILDQDAKVYDKSKLVNMILSFKRETEGHKLRPTLIRPDIDLWGQQHKTFSYKLEALKEYAFTVCVQNSRVENYFSEALIDCFRTGTIPIYWGCPNIGDFFDENGIIQFTNKADLDTIIDGLSFELYESKKRSIFNNLLKAQNYVSVEDTLFRYL
jgi:hypothetical protein